MSARTAIGRHHYAEQSTGKCEKDAVGEKLSSNSSRATLPMPILC